MTDKVVFTDTNGSHRETGTRVVWTDNGSHRETVSVGGGPSIVILRRRIEGY
jgi:hypothetical protein